jgi:CheY-like chemotaxis protein
MNKSNNRRILIVDDNTSIHQDFKKVLIPEKEEDLSDIENVLFDSEETSPFDSKIDKKIFDYRLDFASQGDEALSKVKKSLEENDPYALVFMDVRMPPGPDGIETTNKIWELDPRLV